MWFENQTTAIFECQLTDHGSYRYNLDESFWLDAIEKPLNRFAQQKKTTKVFRINKSK
jgi:hypothetical protein